ncbi:MAG: EAL domain-containing protein, partial [Proteobacteria bacterium]|nr:EAL domain-containing protein [Pseudomonadota bacterium]
ENSDSSMKICNVIILLAQQLELLLVIEGVERWSQIDRLDLSDDNELQGFLFSEPLENLEFLKWLPYQDSNPDLEYIVTLPKQNIR